MTEILILALLVLAAAALLAALAAVVRGDGYGDRRHEPPRSHERDAFDGSTGSWRTA